MLETIILILIFMMGAYFGSFYTLAIYRIPLGLDITHERSFCPKCNHKLGVLDLFPILSYIFLGGKCRYCKNKIKPRYFILEILSGLTFLAYTLSLNINIYNLETEKLALLGFSFLYFAGIFIIAGIDKEKLKIQKELLIYIIIVSAIYMIYLYIVQKISIYRYVIYLLAIIFLIILDILKLRKKGNESYTLNAVILGICMAVFTGVQVFILTAIYTALTCAIYVFIKKIIQNRKKFVKKENNENKHLPIAFFMCTCNIILYIFLNFIVNYLIIN